MYLIHTKTNQKETLVPLVRFLSVSSHYDIVRGCSKSHGLRQHFSNIVSFIILEITLMSINYEVLGDRIRLVRTSRDLSQEKLAEAANLTRESINRIEKGSLKAKLDTIAVIAGILNIPIDYLIGNEKELPADSEAEIRSLLLDCNRLEKKILVETLRSLKTILYSAGI